MVARRTRFALPLVTLAALGAASLSPRAAHAYCRTTTCDAADADADCTRDAKGCSETGAELYWPSRCLGFSVHQDGSAKRGVPWEALDGLVLEGFLQWESADCGGKRPSFEIHDVNDLVGPAECPEPEFNRADEVTQKQTLANANVWMFRDADWPYVGSLSTLALTTVTFGVQSGKILDADVELNSFAVDLTTGDQGIASDTLSIVTHEAGHFLGLAHSDADLATMSAGYRRGSVDFRTLAPDDEAGICTIYPPDRDVPACDEPAFIGGWAAECSAPASETLAGETDPSPPTIYEGCTCRSARAPRPGAANTALAALGLAFLGLRSRRRG